MAVSKTCLVRFDNNHYSVAARAVGRPVDVRAYADRIVIRQGGETGAEHPRSFGRGEIAYDPWHYVPILTRKPGALRNGAPFKGWQLPGALGRIRARLTGCDDGDRQFEPPRVYRRAFGSNIRLLFMCVQGFIEHLLCFVRRDISDGAVKTLGVVPIDPFLRFPFKLAIDFHGPVTL